MRHRTLSENEPKRTQSARRQEMMATAVLERSYGNMPRQGRRQNEPKRTQFARRAQNAHKLCDIKVLWECTGFDVRSEQTQFKRQNTGHRRQNTGQGGASHPLRERQHTRAGKDLTVRLTANTIPSNLPCIGRLVEKAVTYSVARVFHEG